MKIQCPSCHFSAEIDPARLPATGTNARCPRCKSSFRVIPPLPVAADEESPLSIVPPAGAPRAGWSGGRGALLGWAQAGDLACAALPAAFRLSGITPSSADWRLFLDRLALWLGALFLAVGVIFYFAANWQGMGRLSKLALVEGLLLAALASSWRLGLDRMSGKAALLVSTLLVGALLALTGQIYQTGADPWELFAVWALAISPWVAVGRFTPLWIFWVALLNLAISLYFSTFGGLFGLLFGSDALFWTLFAINSAALAAQEVAGRRGQKWLQERWSARILAGASAATITTLAIMAIVEYRSSGAGAFVAYPLWLLVAYLLYCRWQRDLFILASGVLSLIIVITAFLSKSLLHRGGDAGGFLLIGLLVIGMSAAGGYWLKVLSAEEET